MKKKVKQFGSEGGESGTGVLLWYFHAVYQDSVFAHQFIYEMPTPFTQGYYKYYMW